MTNKSTTKETSNLNKVMLFPNFIITLFGIMLMFAWILINIRIFNSWVVKPTDNQIQYYNQVASDIWNKENLSNYNFKNIRVTNLNINELDLDSIDIPNQTITNFTTSNIKIKMDLGNTEICISNNKFTFSNMNHKTYSVIFEDNSSYPKIYSEDLNKNFDIFALCVIILLNLILIFIIICLFIVFISKIRRKIKAKKASNY